MNKRKVYQDRAGNKLYRSFNKSTGLSRFEAVNRDKQLLAPTGTKILLKKAGFKVKGNLKKNSINKIMVRR